MYSEVKLISKERERTNKSGGMSPTEISSNSKTAKAVDQPASTGTPDRGASKQQYVTTYNPKL